MRFRGCLFERIFGTKDIECMCFPLSCAMDEVMITDLAKLLLALIAPQRRSLRIISQPSQHIYLVTAFDTHVWVVRVIVCILFLCILLKHVYIAVGYLVLDK